MELIFDSDPHGMNWLRPDYPYADVRFASLHSDEASGDLEATVSTVRDGDAVRTEIVITNVSQAPVFTSVGDIGITLPLEDRYDLGGDQDTQRCNAHVFCGGTSSFVLALRMGGAAPHLGLVLTEGDLVAYSIERDVALQSNDRGCFILHPAPLALQPGERSMIAWVIFPCEDKDDFFVQAARRTRFVRAEWDQYVLFTGETTTLRLTPSFAAADVTVNGASATPQGDGTFSAVFDATAPGEHAFVVQADDRTVCTRILVKEPLPVLLERRCAFIARHQQYNGPIEMLEGAFLAYDNEHDAIFYSRINDYNAGRERIGMGILLADYLSALRDGIASASDPSVASRLRWSLARYVEFVERELVDVATGAVFNDAGRDASQERLYNAPWVATFYLALHRLDGDAARVLVAYRVIRAFYAAGGAAFYPLELPVLELCDALHQAGFDAEKDEASALFHHHSRTLASTGRNYPPSEVNYEQSIVAPAADILLQTFLLTGDPALLVAGEEQLTILDQFHGVQPDHHLHDVAVRHWDGYWFGKRQTYGDTFPHYWSALTGNVLALHARITGDAATVPRAENIIRGVLPLIFDDGRASCAYVFPHSVNGERADYADPYANDQDWALVFALRSLRGRTVAAASDPVSIRS
ncbi:hypothetical protein [Microbacterium sp. P5_E9]